VYAVMGMVGANLTHRCTLILDVPELKIDNSIEVDLANIQAYNTFLSFLFNTNILTVIQNTPA
jgi:hypothetical protein